MSSVNEPRGGSSRAALTLSIIALLTAAASAAFSGWQLRQYGAERARVPRSWSMAMTQHAVSDLSFAARTLLTQVVGELHIAQFLCSQSSDPALRARADYLEQAVESQSRHSTFWSLSHQAEEEELDRIDARLASGSLDSKELAALSTEIGKIKSATQEQLNNIWAIASECLGK